MKKILCYLLLIFLFFSCKISTAERLRQTKALRDTKQAELKKLSESFTNVTPANIESISKQMEPLRTTVDSLDRLVDSLEGNDRHRKWRHPGPNGKDE